MFVSLPPRLAGGFRSLFLVPSTQHHCFSETGFSSCLMWLGTPTNHLPRNYLFWYFLHSVWDCSHMMTCDCWPIFLYDCQLAPYIQWYSYFVGVTVVGGQVSSFSSGYPVYNLASAKVLQLRTVSWLIIVGASIALYHFVILTIHYDNPYEIHQCGKCCLFLHKHA